MSNFKQKKLCFQYLVKKISILFTINICQQSVTKHLAKSKKIKQNWTKPERFDICFA